MEFKYTAGMQILGRYVLRECIDTGGEAQVWRATQESHNVAIKLRPPVSRNARDDMQKRIAEFTNEKDSWIEFTRSSLFIVTIFEIITDIQNDDEGVEWLILGIVSEYSELGDIRRAIKDKALGKYLQTERQVVQFLLQIISGVKAGHEVQRYHCDIKPGNILLFRNGNDVVPKLTDFGIAGTPLEPIRGGTPGYSAPELSPGVSPTAASDIYSLGITFYDILYATLLKTREDVKTAISYRSGKDYKRYLTETFDEATAVSNFHLPYKNLAASMASEKPEDRPKLDQITSVLMKSLTEGASQYHSKTKRDTYVWSPMVHEGLDEKLYYVLLKGGNPTIDVQNLISDLNHANLKGFSLRSVIGAWDYVIRIWVPNSPAALKELNDAVARTSAGNHHALEVLMAHFATPRVKKTSRTSKLTNKESDIQILQGIEKCAGPGAKEKLRQAGYVNSLLNTSSTYFRVTLLVSIPRELVALAPVIGGVVRDRILQADATVRDLRYYDVKSSEFDVRLVVKFMHKDFVSFRTTLFKVFESLERYGKLGFSTLLDMNAPRDVLSDDGAIISRIEAVHSAIA